jgi:hypothetical protein
VLGEFLQGGTGDLPAARLVRVVVADDKEAEARGIIADWERAEPATAPPAMHSRRALVAKGFFAGVVCGALLVWWLLALR